VTIVPAEPGMSRRSGKNAKAPAARIGIMVVGMHRSGTSGLTKMLSLLGATLPRTLPSSVENNDPTGFFESAKLRVLNDRMLVEVASRWDHCRAFDPSMLGPERLAVYKEEILRLLEEEYGDARPLVLKDPRICQGRARKRSPRSLVSAVSSRRQCQSSERQPSLSSRRAKASCRQGFVA